MDYVNGAAFLRSDKTDKDNSDGSRGWQVDCMNPSDPVGDGNVNIGSMRVDEFGKGTGTYTIPVGGVISGPTDEVAVCLSQRFADIPPQGLQAPLTIV